MRRGALCTCLCLTLSAAACADSTPFFGHSAEPALYVSLSRDPLMGLRAASRADSGLRALLVTAGDHRGSPFRLAQQVTMTRRSDGREFDWRTVARSGVATVPQGFGSSAGLFSVADSGNLYLPWTGTGGRLGRADLTGGETYDLIVVTDGRTITGSARLPGDPSPVLTEEAGTRTVHWQRPAGAVEYWTWADTDRPFFRSPRTTDTSYALRYDGDPATYPQPPRFSVVAIDENMALLQAPGGSAARRAGIVGGLGYFIAMGSGWTVIPP